MRPHFEVHFTVSYGLERAQLEELNFMIKSSDPILYDDASSVQVCLPAVVGIQDSEGLPCNS
jgi:hypothetical protein